MLDALERIDKRLASIDKRLADEQQTGFFFPFNGTVTVNNTQTIDFVKFLKMKIPQFSLTNDGPDDLFLGVNSQPITTAPIHNSEKIEPRYATAIVHFVTLQSKGTSAFRLFVSG
jgi:hypothetical protein